MEVAREADTDLALAFGEVSSTAGAALVAAVLPGADGVLAAVVVAASSRWQRAKALVLLSSCCLSLEFVTLQINTHVSSAHHTVDTAQHSPTLHTVHYRVHCTQIQ